MRITTLNRPQQRRSTMPLRRTTLTSLLLCLMAVVPIRNVGADQDVDDWVSQDDVQSQWPIRDFQIDLWPTPEPLGEVDYILGPAIEEVVRQTMQGLFPDTFEYMYVANVKTIELHSPDAHLRMLQPEDPVTTVIFNGGVVAFDSKPTVDITELVKASIASGLVPFLRSKGLGLPWGKIEHASFTLIEGLPDAPPVDEEGGTPTDSPSSESSPRGGEFDGIQEEPTSIQSTSSFPTTQQIVGGFFGVAMIVLGLALFVRISKGRQQQQPHGNGPREELSKLTLDPGAADAAEFGGVTLTSSRKSKTTTKKKKKSLSAKLAAAGAHKNQDPNKTFEDDDMSDGNDESNAYVFEDKDDETEQRSEMAQYAAEPMDASSVNPSVASSEWTMATSDEGTSTGSTITGGGGVSSPLPHLHNNSGAVANSRAAAMAYASQETFERDRLVTLQKDMLQSDWTSSPPKQAVVATAILAPPIRPKSSSKLSIQQQGSDNSSSDGQGEEVYLMPPTTKFSTSTDDGSDDDDDEHYGVC